MNPKIDKSSREFDLLLLAELKSLTNIPVNQFEVLILKIMRRKNYCKLWWSNRETMELDEKDLKYRKCNYRCCPNSSNAKYMFCLVLERKETGITVQNGFLSAI